MRIQLLPLTVLALALYSQNILVGQTKQLADYDDETAYEVYSAVISLRDTSGTMRATNFVIRQETLRNFGGRVDDGSEPNLSVCLRPDPAFERLIGPAISDYIRMNKTKWLLEDRFEFTVPYELVPPKRVLSLINKDGWDVFHKKYPGAGGFIDLSAVGFNADKSIAVVSKGNWCGELCGEGSYYVLQKKDGKWVPLDWKGQRCRWMS